MTSDTASRFKVAVTDKLRLLGPELVPVLQKLIAHQYPPEVVSLDFEIFPDGFSEGFPVRAFFMDDENSEHFLEVDGKWVYPSPVDPGLIQITFVYDEAFEATFLELDADLDTYTLAGEALVPWFADCWTEAGGAAFDRGATIMLHDDLRSFDLVHRSWRPPDAA